MQLQSFSHLESMVSKPTWKDVLLELIASNRIDPWNLDISALADAFIKRVREMEQMDFAVQANVILAASILLKYKSNYLKLLSYQTDIDEFVPDDLSQMPGIETLPELSLASRIPPKRQITLDELLGEMERVIKYDQMGERAIVPRGSITETVDLDLGDRDIDRDMHDVLEKVRAHTDSTGWSLFSRLVHGCDMRETVYHLLCLLYLVQLGSIDIKQDELFGEVFIQLIDGKVEEKAQT